MFGLFLIVSSIEKGLGLFFLSRVVFFHMPFFKVWWPDASAGHTEASLRVERWEGTSQRRSQNFR